MTDCGQTDTLHLHIEVTGQALVVLWWHLIELVLSVVYTSVAAGPYSSLVYVLVVIMTFGTHLALIEWNFSRPI